MMILFSATSFAEVAKSYTVVDDRDAVIDFSNGYDKPTIQIDGRTYWLVPAKGLYNIGQTLEQIVGNNKFHSVSRTPAGQAIGIVSGNTFKALVLEFSLPRSLD